MIVMYIVKDIRDPDPANHKVRIVSELVPNDPRPTTTVQVPDGVLADAAITHLSSLVSSMKRDLGNETVVKLEIGQ
jgi:hypothetical protein